MWELHVTGLTIALFGKQNSHRLHIHIYAIVISLYSHWQTESCALEMLIISIQVIVIRASYFLYR